MAENQQYDIVFVLDRSGSMKEEHIDEVKTNIKSCVEKLNTYGVDVQLGLVEYGDGYFNIKKHELTSDVETFIRDLNDISGGGDKENGLTAIMDATNGAISMNFREGSNKEIIVVTDEGYSEKYNSNYSQDSVITQLQEMGAKLDVFGDMNNKEDCKTEWEPIANATSGWLIEGDGNPVNGQFYDIQNDFSTLFKAAIVDGIVEPPTTGTHQVSFTQWGFGYTPTDAATLASDSSNSITITPSA